MIPAKVVQLSRLLAFFQYPPANNTERLKATSKAGSHAVVIA